VAARTFIAFALISMTAIVPSVHAADAPPEPEKVMINTKIKIPTAGMTMKQVEKAFGPPAKKLDPVGKPPITRWMYDQFTVYFEKQYVIHAVVPRALMLQSKEQPEQARPTLPPLPVPVQSGVLDDGPIDTPFQ